MKQTTETAPCPTWFADNEFNLGVWGAVAFAGDDEDGDDGRHPLIIREELPRRAGRDGRDDNDRNFIDDTAFGGGIDLKYFFARYFGIGISTFGLWSGDDENGEDFNPRHIRRLRRFGTDVDFDDNGNDDDGMGAVLGTFTFRYPIPCTRFAPYAFVGGGVAFGGNGRNGDHDQFRFVHGEIEDFVRLRRGDNDNNNNDAAAIGQIGGGLETRFTPNIGLTADVSWNVTEGDSWAMFRTGLNFAF